MGGVCRARHSRHRRRFSLFASVRTGIWIPVLHENPVVYLVRGGLVMSNNRQALNEQLSLDGVFGPGSTELARQEKSLTRYFEKE